jgi:large subunit ribosomal protein L4
MKATPLSLADASKTLKVELIANGKGSQALHETVVAYRANRRAGTHSTLTKATVNRSGKKPWRQKGTGNARAGYASSQPRDYSKKTPKAVKQLALKKAFSERVKAGDVFLVDAIKLSSPKTKELVGTLAKTIGANSALIVIEAADKNLYLAARNHPDIETTTGEHVNAEQLLRYDKVLLTEGALGKISNRLKD